MFACLSKWTAGMDEKYLQLAIAKALTKLIVPLNALSPGMQLNSR